MRYIIGLVIDSKQRRQSGERCLGLIKKGRQLAVIAKARFETGLLPIRRHSVPAFRQVVSSKWVLWQCNPFAREV